MGYAYTMNAHRRNWSDRHQGTAAFNCLTGHILVRNTLQELGLVFVAEDLELCINPPHILRAFDQSSEVRHAGGLDSGDPGS